MTTDYQRAREEWRYERRATWRALARKALLQRLWRTRRATTMHVYGMNQRPNAGETHTRYMCLVCGNVSWDGQVSLRHEDVHLDDWIVANHWLDPDAHQELADVFILACEAMATGLAELRAAREALVSTMGARLVRKVRVLCGEVEDVLADG